VRIFQKIIKNYNIGPRCRFPLIFFAAVIVLSLLSVLPHSWLDRTSIPETGRRDQALKVRLPTGLPDGIFSNQKFQFRKILEGLGMEIVGLFTAI
jgi:hypothetical protein